MRGSLGQCIGTSAGKGSHVGHTRGGCDHLGTEHCLAVSRRHRRCCRRSVDSCSHSAQGPSRYGRCGGVSGNMGFCGEPRIDV